MTMIKKRESVKYAYVAGDVRYGLIDAQEFFSEQEFGEARW